MRMFSSKIYKMVKFSLKYFMNFRIQDGIYFLVKYLIFNCLDKVSFQLCVDFSILIDVKVRPFFDKI